MYYIYYIVTTHICVKKKKKRFSIKTLGQQHRFSLLFAYSTCYWGGHRLLPYFLLIVSIITNCQLSRIKSLLRCLIDEISVDVFPEERRELVNLDLRKSTGRDIGTLPPLPSCNTESRELSTQSEMFLPAGWQRERERERDTHRTDSLWKATSLHNVIHSPAGVTILAEIELISERFWKGSLAGRLR